MNIILLSGGSGKRLWPLSNDIRSKQFIKIFKKEDGTYESMVQRVYRQIKKVDTDDVVISASPEGILVSDKEQSSYIKPFVDKFEQQIMFAEKSWGSFKVVDVENTSLTISHRVQPAEWYGVEASDPHPPGDGLH